MASAIRLLIIGGAILAAVLLGPLTLPTWAVVAVAVGVCLVVAELSVKRFRQERRLADRFWRFVRRR
jgi:hypothetical protein